MVVRALGLGFLHAQQPSGPAHVVKAESLGNLGGADQLAEGGGDLAPRRRVGSSGLLSSTSGADGPEGVDERAINTAIMQLLQQSRSKESLLRHSPRASHDSILDLRCTSDPSHSNRPSLDGRDPLPTRAVAGPIDYEASSAPCSNRPSLDERAAEVAAAAARTAELLGNIDPHSSAPMPFQCWPRKRALAGESSTQVGAAFDVPAAPAAAEATAIPSSSRPVPFAPSSLGMRASLHHPIAGGQDIAGSPFVPPMQSAARRSSYWGLNCSSCPMGGLLAEDVAAVDGAMQPGSEQRPQRWLAAAQLSRPPPPPLPAPAHPLSQQQLQPPQLQLPPQPPPQQQPQWMAAGPSLPPGPSAFAAAPVPPRQRKAPFPPVAPVPPVVHPRQPLASINTTGKPKETVASLLATWQEGQGSGLSAAAAAAAAAGNRSKPSTRDSSGDLGDLLVDVHGTYGCHVMAAPPHPEPAATALADALRSRITSRSSIDLLLEPLPTPSAAAAARQSMELQELLAPLGSPRAAAAMLLHNPRLSLDSNSSRDGMPRRSVTPTSRQAGCASSYFTPQQRQMSADLQGLPLRGMQHAISTNAIADLAVAELDALDAPAGITGGQGGATASAFASSVVDTSCHLDSSSHVDDYGHGGMGTSVGPQESWLDPDLHDTFGAHAMPLQPLSLSSSAAPSGHASPMQHSRLLGTAMAGASPRVAGRSGALQPTVLSFGRAAGSADGAGNGGGGAAARLATPLQTAGSGRSPLLPPPQHGSPAGSAGSPRAQPAGPRHTSMLEPSTMPGQHSVTVSDPQTSVPSLEFLRQRRVAKQRLEAASCSGGGYIAEAKRVLSAAMSTADPLETLLVQSSQSGAIGPLLRHLSLVKHDDAALRSGLHTLSLIISNSPNRDIIISFKGQQMLFDILHATRDLEVQEDIIQLLWDLESVSVGSSQKDCKPDIKCMGSFVSILERTSSATIASHVIHFMYGFRHLPAPGPLLEETTSRLLGVVDAGRYHLQDAAQYTLGLLLTAILDEKGVGEATVAGAAESLLSLLHSKQQGQQKQAVLTLLSCIAASPRARRALCAIQARAQLLQFGQAVGDTRLRARALSLVKVLNKAELRGPSHSGQGQ